MCLEESIHSNGISPAAFSVLDFGLLISNWFVAVVFYFLKAFPLLQLKQLLPVQRLILCKIKYMRVAFKTIFVL